MLDGWIGTEAGELSDESAVEIIKTGCRSRYSDPRASRISMQRQGYRGSDSSSSSACIVKTLLCQRKSKDLRRYRLSCPRSCSTGGRLPLPNCAGPHSFRKTVVLPRASRNALKLCPLRAPR